MIGKLIDSKVQPNSQELQELGIKVGRLFTDHGLPIDIALGRLPHTKEQKISILDGACQWFIEHKRKSGANDKSIERQREQNKKIISDFLTSGEVGIY